MTVSLPTYWSWAPPLGTAATHPRIKQIVRVSTRSNLGTDRGGDGTADAVDAEVTSLGLGAGDVALLLQNFGNTYTGGTCRMWRHPDDEVSGNVAPFFANGVAECRLWTRDFIDQYDVNGTVDPYALWMDTEERITVNNLFGNWASIIADPRWSSEKVFPDGSTWADQGVPSVGSSLSDPSNYAWLRSVRPRLYVAQSHAMSLSFFNQMRNRWPDVLSANWVTSWDGTYWSGEVENYTIAETVGCTHQSPNLYGTTSGFFEDFETRADVIRATYALQVNQTSITGWSKRPMAPWILGYGEGGAGMEGALATDYYDQVIRRGIEDGIPHYLVWQNTLSTEYLDVSNWNSLVSEIETAEATAIARLQAIASADDMTNKAPQTYTKHPDEVRSATMSFRHKLSTGDTLTGTPTVVASPSGPTITNIAVVSSAVQGDYINASASQAVRFKIAGGTDGTTYRLTIACSTAGGETLVGLADVTVEDEAPA